MNGDGDRAPVSLDVIIEDDGWTALGALGPMIEVCAAEASALAPGLLGGEASLCLTDDEALRDLNQRFRGKDKPTNVLSFPAAAAFRPFLGDIAVAYGVLSREAAEKGIALADHLAHLIIHGLLHLIGYDHETAHDAAVMEDLETRILARLGVNDPYRFASDDSETRT